MAENNPNTISSMEDISSTSVEFRARKNPVLAYTSGLYKNLGNIIKIISFILGFGVIILALVAAFFVFNKTALGIVLSLAIVIFGTIVAGCIFFPIFGLGHILCQNNEILKLLNK